MTKSEKVVITELTVDRDKPRNIDFGLFLWTGNDSGLPTGLSLRLTFL